MAVYAKGRESASASIFHFPLLNSVPRSYIHTNDTLVQISNFTINGGQLLEAANSTYTKISGRCFSLQKISGRCVNPYLYFLAKCSTNGLVNKIQVISRGLRSLNEQRKLKN